MVIRCERCSTLYELDETLLAPEGSAVQCSRCDHVFTARRSASGEGAELRSDSTEPTAPPAALEPAAPSPGAPLDPPTPDAIAAGDVAPPSPRAESSGPRAPADEPRYARGASPAVYRPTPGPTSVRAHPVLRRDTVGAFESRLRWSARLRWLVPAVAVGLVVLGAAGFFLLRGHFAPRAADARVERPASPAREGTRALRTPPPAPPPAASPEGSPAGNVTPPERNTFAQRPPAAARADVAPVPPGTASAAPAPAAAEASTPPASPAQGGAPVPTRGLSPSALMPASVPDVAPASGMPQIAPPGATEGSRHPVRAPAVQDEAIGGG